MKRATKAEPLTADDVAERLDRAALRVLLILRDTRLNPHLQDDVKRSRHLSPVLVDLRAELGTWLTLRESAPVVTPAGGEV